MRKHCVKFISAVIILSGVFSCGSPKPEETNGTEPKKDSTVVTNSVYTNDCKSYFDEAMRMDSVIINATEVNVKVGNSAIKAFTDFSYFCTKDTLAPVFLLKASQIAQSINNLPQAQICLERCLSDFPDFHNRGAAMFLLAQMNDEPRLLNNEEKAQEMYRSILTNYPHTDWARNADAALKLIGKSDAEIIKEFNKKNKK